MVGGRATEERMPAIRALEAAPLAWPLELSSKAAAVLCLFIPGLSSSAAARIVFIRRSDQVRTHRGQIGFPGGRREICDMSPSDTALRESWEEIGLDPERVKVLGSLPQVKALDLSPVIPIVAEADIDLKDFICNAAEVAEVFALPWTSFHPSEERKLRFNVFGRWRETPLYPASGYQVWGLTALMLKLARLDFSEPFPELRG